MFYCPFRFLLAAGLILLSITTTATEAGEAALRKHVAQLTSGKGYRNYKDTLALNRTAAYIYNEFSAVTKETYTQDFTVKGTRYRNVYASFGPVNAPRIIIGAHYDVCGDQPGADDNASGVAALLELARMFAETDKSKWEMRVDLVAYSLEEPPYFGTQDMGSSVHATALFNNKTPVVGMVSLEMIGYFDDESGSQQYPLGIMKLFYGSRGDYITVVRKWGCGRFARLFTRKFRHAGGVETKVFKGPKWIKGVDFSDHRNYWKYDWPALMVTDGAFYRNKNYHTADDKPETLDYLRMSSVVTKVYKAIVYIM